MRRPSFGFDGGFIMASWDGFEEAVEWYGKHFGWECAGTELTSIGKMAFFPLPRFGQANLKSFQTEWEHYHKDEYNEGHLRLCFCVADLESTTQYFSDHGINVLGQFQLPDGRAYIDIEAFEGARISAVHFPQRAGQFLDSRLISFGDIALIIKVSDLNRSVAWYEKVLGFEKITSSESDSAVLLKMGISKHGQKEPDAAFPMHVWMIEDKTISASPKGNPMARAYFHIPPQELELSRQWLQSHGIQVSGLANSDYHFYDPDGNRINVWSYEM